MELNDNDYQAWGLRNCFTITEASFLWFDLRPLSTLENNWMFEDPTLPASLLFYDLKKAVYQCEIEVLDVKYVPSIPDTDIPKHIHKEGFRLREKDARRHGLDSNMFRQILSDRSLQEDLKDRGRETTDEAIKRLWEKSTSLLPVSDEGCEQWKVTRADLIKFAKNRKLAPRFLFGDTRDELFRLKDEIDKLNLENKQLKSVAPGYLDRDHPHYAPRLHAALLFWEKHFSEGSHYGPGNVKDAFQVWYESTWIKSLHGDEFSSTPQDCIAKVATPQDRKGGRPKKSN